MRIPAYSLLLSLILSVVIFGISNSVLLESLLFQNEVQLQRKQVQLSLNSYSGINFALEYPGLALETIPLFEEDSVLLIRKPWGVFEIIHSSALDKGKAVHPKSVLAGSPMDKDQCLYLANTNRALSLSGQTFIEGKAIVPKMGVKRAYIEGKNFSGKHLVNGAIQYSTNSQLPPNKELAPSTYEQFKPQEDDSLVFLDDLPDTLIHPYNERRISVLCESKYLNGFYKGNILLYSEGELEISSSVLLNDVLVSAKSLEIQSSQFSAAQYYASESIQVENSELAYPSILILNRKSQEEKKEGIRIENSLVDGGVYLNTDQNQRQQSIGIRIDKKSTVRGELVSDNWIELKGKVIGSVTAHHFFLKTPSSVYENHLLDATISSKELPDGYLSLANQSSKKILKWLD